MTYMLLQLTWKARNTPVTGCHSLRQILSSDVQWRQERSLSEKVRLSIHLLFIYFLSATSSFLPTAFLASAAYVCLESRTNSFVAKVRSSNPLPQMACVICGGASIKGIQLMILSNSSNSPLSSRGLLHTAGGGTRACEARNPLSKQCFSWLDRSNNTGAGEQKTQVGRCGEQEGGNLPSAVSSTGKETGSEGCQLATASPGAREPSFNRGCVAELPGLGVPSRCVVYERCMPHSGLLHSCSPCRIDFWNPR